MKIVDYEPKWGKDVARVWRKTKIETLQINDPHSQADYLDYLTNELLDKYKVKVAIDENEDFVLGLMVYNEEEINQLYICKNAQGSGIGRRFMMEAKEHSKGSLWLYTFQKNVRAVKFYKDHGFIIKASGLDNEEQLPDYKMVWNR